MIHKDMLIEEITTAYPQTIHYFRQLRIDHQRSAQDSLSRVADQHNLSILTLLQTLNTLSQQPAKTLPPSGEGLDDFRQLSFSAMLRDIERTHHRQELSLLSEISHTLNIILASHYHKHGEHLTRLHHLFAVLRAELEEYFTKETHLIFPLMHQHPFPDPEQITVVRELALEHQHIAELAEEIRRHTRSFALPEDACPIYAMTYRKMKELLADIRWHISKENVIIFPHYCARYVPAEIDVQHCDGGDPTAFCGAEAQSLDDFKDAAHEYASVIFRNSYTGMPD